MSDRFKFRAWDSHNKMFWFSESIGLQSFFTLRHGEGSFEKPIQQSTGLKDKNGKLIFEGDIVKAPATGKDHIGVVEWQGSPNGYWKTVMRKDEGFSSSGLSNYGGEWEPEIIGNIHENPELLK